MKILALDMSLTAPGICNPDGSTETLRPKGRGMERLHNIVGEVLVRATTLPGIARRADVVVIEGYSFASKGRAAVSLGELGGIVRYSLWCDDVPYVEIPPTCRAKYATGRGNASKDDVLQQAVLRSGHVFEDNNSADAWWLHQMALAHYEPTSPLLVKMPAGNREVLAKVAWADVGKEAAA